MCEAHAILSAVRAYVGAKIARPISDHENYFESGFVKSLFGIQLISFIEGRFDTVISDDDLVASNFNSIEHVVAFICRKKDIQFDPAV